MASFVGKEPEAELGMWRLQDHHQQVCGNPLPTIEDILARLAGECYLLALSSDGEHPIAYASRTLTKAKRNYSQIEKEALALVFRVKCFYKYL